MADPSSDAPRPRRRRRRRWLGAVATVLVLVLVGGAATGIVLARRSFPRTAGELTLGVLDAPVEVLRDGHGVPTIVATTSADLFRAQGFVHAQDRFWEMDFRRHVTAGRLAELFGESQVATDRFVRTLGWRRVAEAELDLLQDDTVAMLEAYAEGVNAYLDGRTGSELSLEHALLPVAGARGYEPEPWTPADSVAWLKAMAWDLRSNLEDELERGRLATVDLGPGRDLEDLWVDFPHGEHRTILDGGTVVDGVFDPDAELGGAGPADGSGSGVDDDGAAGAEEADATADGGTDASPDAAGDEVAAALAATQRALAAAPRLLGDGADEGIGSNSWVVAPERSATGSALLANDPHLGPAQPSIWYQVGLRCAEVTPDCPYHVSGFSFSGLPGIVIGQNAHLAWGFTNLGPDVADTFVERLDGDGNYLTEDGWRPLEVHEEILRVAGGGDVPLRVRATRHGPLLSDVDDAARDVAGGPVATADGPPPEGVTHAVSLRWTALEPTPTADAIPRFMRAEDGDAFREAASYFQVPSQNLVWAEEDGTIGYQAPGLIPVRRSGDGTVPTPGWTADAGWERFLAFDELPHVEDPDEGVIITANQAVLPDGAEPFLTRDPDGGFRAARIGALLEGRDELTLRDLLEVQLDTYNGNAAALVPALLAVDATRTGDAEGVVRDTQRLLSAWDLHDDVDAAGSAVFNATWRALLARTFEELPDWAAPSGGSRWWLVVRELLATPDSPWWDDVATDEVETRDDVLAAAMVAAHGELSDRLGGDPDAWAWGDLHQLTLTHQTFGTSGIAPVERLFNRGPLRLGGGTSVVNANGWDASEGYEVDWVPSMRLLVDVGDRDAGRWIHLTGQSGHPFHPHYSDQAETWAAGETLPIAFSPDAVEAAAVDRLTLTPWEGS